MVDLTSRTTESKRLLILVAILALAGAVRLVPLLGSDFPLHDGGLFFVMSSEIRAASFSLPLETSFNGAHIPFAYPPLGLLIAAVGSYVADPFLIFRFLPWLYSVATVAGVYWVGRVLRGPTEGAAAAFAFALIPNSFDWLILGGGVTRGLGLALALACIATGAAAMAKPSWARVIGTGFLGGLTLLTHPEASLFAAISLALILAFKFRRVEALLMLVSAGAIGFLVSSPWWITVISRHGPELVVDALSSRSEWQQVVLRLIDLQLTGAAFLVVDVFLLLGLAGVVRETQRRSWDLLGWITAVSLLMPGAGTTYATVPLAMLCAVAIVGIGVPFARSNARLTKSAVGIAWAAALFSILTLGLSPLSPVAGIPQSDRIVMQEVRGSGIGDVAVLTGRPWWGEGPGEWFPALSGQRNPALVQGSEWLGLATWDAQVAANSELQQCVERSADCVVAWMQDHGVDHVMLSAVVDKVAVVREELSTSDRLVVTFRSGLTILYTVSR